MVDLAPILVSGREAMRERMLDTCVVRSPDGAPVFDPSTGGYTTGPDTDVYVGPCEVRSRDAQVQAQDVGGAVVTERRSVVALPVVGSEGVAAGQVVTVTAAAWDAGLVGRRYDVTGVLSDSLGLRRDLLVEEVSS